MTIYNTSFRLADEMGRMTSLRIGVFGADADAAATNAAAIAAHLAAVTKLGLISGSMTVDLVVTPTSAAVGSNTDVGGKCKGSSYTDGKIVVLRVPDPIAAIINTTGGFDLEEEHLEAYLGDFFNAANGRISDGEAVDTWYVGALDAK
jgi:hypothetical protein